MLSLCRYPAIFLYLAVADMYCKGLFTSEGADALRLTTQGRKASDIENLLRVFYFIYTTYKFIVDLVLSGPHICARKARFIVLDKRKCRLGNITMICLGFVWWHFHPSLSKNSLAVFHPYSFTGL